MVGFLFHYMLSGQTQTKEEIKNAKTRPIPCTAWHEQVHGTCKNVLLNTLRGPL